MGNKATGFSPDLPPPRVPPLPAMHHFLTNQVASNPHQALQRPLCSLELISHIIKRVVRYRKTLLFQIRVLSPLKERKN